MTIVEAPDLRGALKARHRAAILAAANDLVAEGGGPDFTVDELAARAGVARRTVFNHFASLDEVLLTLCDASLAVLIDDFVAAVSASPTGDGTLASMFDELVATLRETELLEAVLRINVILGGESIVDHRRRALSDTAFARASDRLLRAVTERYPEADPLDSRLLLSSLMSGVVVIVEQWTARGSLRLDAASRAEWQQLLTRLITTVRNGYRRAR